MVKPERRDASPIVMRLPGCQLVGSIIGGIVKPPL
jgi:hypothetical protein